jgi:anti-sigma factor RsiW
MAVEQRLSVAERDNLVAYLDGELNEAESRVLASKLTRSVSGRREKEALERTWELLDHLPRPEAPEEFASRTVSQAEGLGAGDEQLARVAGRTARIVVRVAVCLGIAAATVGVAYAGVRWLWPDPTGRLARELPLAEHLEEYREVGTFDFLEQLDQSPAFNSVTE